MSLLYLFVHDATLAYSGSSDSLCCWNRLYHFSRQLTGKHSALSLNKVNLKLFIRQGSSTGFNSVCAAGETFIQKECSSRTFACKKAKRYHRIWAFCWELLYYSSVVTAYEIWKSWINIHPYPLSIICMQHRKFFFLYTVDSSYWLVYEIQTFQTHHSYVLGSSFLHQVVGLLIAE